MNTPAHLIFGAAAFSKKDQRHSFVAAVLGAFVPDLSLYAMVGVSIFILGVPAGTVFREYYYSDAWQAVFAVDNSIILWGVLLGLALWRGWRLVAIFAASALLHLALDFPLHTHDARPHFWPVSDWVFYGPVSYWDSRAYAGVVRPIEVGLSILFSAILFRRFIDWGIRTAVLAMLIAQIFSSGIWRFVF